MADRRRSSLNLGVLLSAVEAAPPIAAAEVFAAALAETLEARDVSFLIADFSGRSLVRLSHVGRGEADGALGRERTETVPLEGTPHELDERFCPSVEVPAGWGRRRHVLSPDAA